jgi:hypothetical protein
MAEERKSSGGIWLGVLALMPWLVYGFASGGNHWRVATAGGMLVCVAYLAVLGRRTTVKLMDWTMLGFFATATVIMVGLHSAEFPIYHVVVIWSFFATAAWISIALRQPFTYAYAREHSPPEFWDNPIFHRVNWILAFFWAGLFSVNVGFAAIGVEVGGNFGALVPGFLLPTALLIFGFMFSKRFPDFYMARIQIAPDGSISRARGASA